MPVYTLHFEATGKTDTVNFSAIRPVGTAILTATAPATWTAYSVVLSGFDPIADRVSFVKNSGTPPVYIRRVRVEGDDGTVYYGAWPNAEAYTYTVDHRDGGAGQDYQGYDVNTGDAYQFNIVTEQYEPAGSGLDWYFAPVRLIVGGPTVGFIGSGTF